MFFFLVEETQPREPTTREDKDYSIGYRLLVLGEKTQPKGVIYLTYPRRLIKYLF